MEKKRAYKRSETVERVLAVIREGGPVFQLERERLSKPRKSESSLRHICLTILRRYHDKPNTTIHLNEFSSALHVERRRIYDIVNILEGFDVFEKKVKNVYVWKGLDMFLVKLRLLEAMGSEAARKIRIFRFERYSPPTKKKALTFLALRFLKVLCVGRGVGVKALVSKFAGLEENSGGGKNKVRRLYDIINVFKAIGLIEKEENNKGFVWGGSEGLLNRLGEIRRGSKREVKDENSDRNKFFQKKAFEDKKDLLKSGKEMKNSGFRMCMGCQEDDFMGFKRVILGNREDEGNREC